MMKRIRSLWLGVSTIVLLIVSLAAEAGSGPKVAPERSQVPSSELFCGPEGVYAKIPARDEFGRDQLAMFRAWNPDPVGNHQANLRTIHPLLARVVRKTQADNPGLPFVIGSGRRGGKLQRRAVAWGWSRTEDSPHQSGLAVDLWPLDQNGHVFFDPATQNRIAAAMTRAAAELGVSIRWGGRFKGFKDKDRSHFELRYP
jgi:peptidoglycan L-alanyl-D-glutamate endopeptidase CwlK